MDAPESRLPFLDEHARVVRASREAVWRALLRVVSSSFGGAASEVFARVVGCDATTAHGVLPEEGSAVVGFRVARVDAGRSLALAGRHRFADYALVFHLDAGDEAGPTTLRAASYARFLGAPGRAYRLAVVGSGVHVVAVRNILRRVAREAAPAEAEAV